MCLYYHDSHTGYTTETTASWLQTNQNFTNEYDRQFSNQCDRCKMLKVVHGNQWDNHCNHSDTQPSIPLLYIYYTVLQRFSLPCLACIHMHTRDITNITRTLLLCCTFKLLLLFVRTGQTKSQPTVWPIIDFVPVYADLNWYNTRNYQWMQTLTTLQ